MDLWVREGAAVHVRLGHRLELLVPARRRREAVGRRAARPASSRSFLKIGDRAAAPSSRAGTTRRAAKMVVVDIDHPDIEDYIDWKVKEEQKVASLW